MARLMRLICVDWTCHELSEKLAIVTKVHNFPAKLQSFAKLSEVTKSRRWVRPLNSWRTSFEPQLRQMSDMTYDLYIHVWMMIYAARVQKRVDTKDFGFWEQFWPEAVGN